MPRKHPATDRSQGGPGSSRQNAAKPQPERRGPEPGKPTNAERSRVSGGGGERDSHHAHDPRLKS